MKTDDRVRGVTVALLAAVLFGASMPFSKLLLGRIDPLLLAGLLYLRSGVGLAGWSGCVRSWRRARIAKHGYSEQIYRGSAPDSSRRRDCSCLADVRPYSYACLLRITALEPGSVFTALLAWFVFRENFDWRIFT